MFPQNGHQLRPQQQQQSGLPSFMPPNASFDSSAYFNLDPSQAAKQMAALSAASQARIATNSRASSMSLPSGGGTSSGPYLGGINSPNYAAGTNDLLATSANGHANFQMPNTHSVPPTPNSAMNPSFLDPAMSHPNASRNPAQGPTSLKQRQQGFLHGLANIMAKRGTPLPPNLTGVSSPTYDPSNSQWSIIEPSIEVGSFRLAGKDVDLFKLWGLVFQHGGGQALTSSNGWGAILPHFDLPENFPQPQPNGSTSVALTLAQHYMYILHPFEEVYRRNLQDTQKKAQMMSAGRPGMPPQQPAGVVGGQNRPQGISLNAPPGMPGQIPRGGMGNGMGLMGQPPPGPQGPISVSNGSVPYPQTHTPQTPHQRPSSSAMNAHQVPPNAGHSMSSIPLSGPMSTPQRSMSNVPDTNLLDQDIQGIKRKLDMDDGENKRVRQKTEPPDGSSVTAGAPFDRNPSALSAAGSQGSQMIGVPRPRAQPSRRKIEYVPLAREVDTYGGRDLKLLESEWANLPQRRPLRDINDWGTIDIEALTMSIRSRLPSELSYALTTFSLLSTMRGQTQGSGFPIFQCVDLLDEVLDLMEDEAFGGPEAQLDVDTFDAESPVVSNRELVNTVYEVEAEPFAALERRQGSKDLTSGLVQSPASIILVSLNIIRNLSIIPDNMEFLAHHDRVTDILLRFCTVVHTEGATPSSASSSLSLGDVIAIRKDVLYTLSNIAGLIHLSQYSSKMSSRIAKRTFDLVASYLIDPVDAVSPLASVQLAGVPLSGNVKPSALADMALEVFTRFGQTDANRQILAKVIPQPCLWQFLECLLHRLPIVDADFQVIRGELWLSYLEKIIMAIYSLAFLAPPEMKERVKTDRKLGFKSVMLRMIQKFLINPNRDSRSWFLVCTKRAVEAMKLLDDAADSFDTSESAMPIMSFGMGFGETGDSGSEKGTGLLGGHRDVAWHMLMVHEVQEDAIMFAELESLARVEY